jgi:hypothetical protein
MLPQLPAEEPRRVCDGCGKAKFLLYSIRTGEPMIAVERVYCSLPCARLHFPDFKGRESGR